MRLLQALAFGVAAAVAVAASIAAQDTAFSQQEKARLEFDRLAESMQRLQVALAESAPDESKTLRAGNRYVQEQRMRERMEGVRDQLKAARWDEALEAMGSVRRDLNVLMNLLLNRDMSLEEILAEMARLEAFKQRVEELIAAQKAEKENAARAEALQNQVEAIEQAKAALDALIRGQEALRQQAKAAGLQAKPSEAERMAGKQGDLKDAAESAAARAKDLERQQRELTDRKAEGAGGAGSCAGSCQGAAGAMAKARAQLGNNKPERSIEDMNQALRQLEQAKRALEEMADEARRQLLQLPFEEQSKRQEVTRIATDKLAEDMEKAGEQGAEKKETPGTPNVQQAVPKQRAAAGMLKDYKPGKAKQEQQNAQEDLEEAKKRLEDALAQLRQQLQDQVLRALEERFGAMLAKQKEISARTVVTDRLRAEALTADGSLPAALVERCQEMSRGELELASEAHDALKLLEDEGTTAVFPEMVVELQGELEGVAELLSACDTDRSTQGRQAEIENLLTLLIDALRRTIENGECAGAGQCNGEPPLVPMSAELKLILGLQKRVAKRTVDYDAQVAEPARGTDEGKAEAAEIARKQGRVHELTRKLAVKVAKQSEAEGGQ